MANIVNYCKNPSFEVNVTDDWTFGQGGSGGSANLDTAQYKVGVKSMRIRAGSAYCRATTTAGIAIPNGGWATISGWVRCSANPTGSKVPIYVHWSDWSANAYVLATVAANGAWEYFTKTLQNTSGGAKTACMSIDNQFNDSAADVWYDGVQLELAAAVSPYTDGAQGEGHSWASTAHNSVSTWTEPASVGNVGISPYMMV